jgi:hypothetical protein
MSKDDKFTYMIRKITSGYNKITAILVHPLTAVGIAMWMSPGFGSEVKDIFLRFVEGDAKLIQQTLQNLNVATGKINNIETAADPDTNEVTMLVTTFEKNDCMAKIKNERLKRDIQQLIDEKNGVISKQKCRIDELLIKMDKNEANAADREKKMNDRFNALMNKTSDISTKLDSTKSTLDSTEIKLDVEHKKAEVSRHKLDAEHKKAEVSRQKLDAEYKKAEVSRQKLDAEHKKAEVSRQKLDLVLTQRVEMHKLPPGDIQQVIILHDRDAAEDECDLYSLRCQTKQIKSRIKQVRKEFGDNIHKIYTIQQPNAITFWNIIKTDLGNKLVKPDNKGWFKLPTMTIRQFKDKLNAYEKERKL